jgi:hypothetical protein
LSILGILVALSIAGALVRPVPAQAQFGGVVSDIGASVQRVVRNAIDAARYISDKADKIISKVSKTVGDVAFKNALKVFLGKVAEDTATWVASAGTGQKPLFLTDPHYFRDLGDAAAGDYLDTLSKEKFGVSLCDPGAFKVTLDIALRVNLNPNFCKEACQQNYADGLDDATVDVNLAIGPMPPKVQSVTLARAREAVAYLQRDLQASVDPWKCKEFGLSNADCLQAYSEAIARAEEKLASELRQCNSMCAANTRRFASCSLTQIQDNAEQGLLASGLTINGQATNITGATLQQAYEDGTLPHIFRPDQNPLGMFLTANVETQAAAEAKKQEEKDILNFSSILPLRSLISGKTKTPGSVTTDTANKKLNPDDAVTKQTGSPVADAIGIFTNTLTSKLIERIFKGGLVDDKGNSKSFISPGTISQSSDGVLAARNRFASLAQVSFGSGGGIDILNELSSCPVDVSVVTETSLGVVQPNNCALDPSFRQAIEEHLTVREALKRGLLSDQKTFGFDANGREPAFGNGYSYRSMVILRKYRIIPVGWELAAQHIRDYEKQNVNLSAIVNKFDDPTSPYYRLVDPSWVLKAPENICRRTGFGNTITSNEYVDIDGDEGGKKSIDYTKRYCNSDSDANVGQVCECVNTAGTVVAVEGLPCISNYHLGATSKEQMSGKCNEETLGNSTKPTCAYITPREQQVQRIETCVDEQTCILENDDGTCKQYGTCVQEKDTWRFNGQSCNELYASCATFTEPAGTQVSYLQNTLQKSVCGPDNAGCQQYCSQYNYTTNTWACTESPVVTRRFDRDLQSCDPSAEGCTQFIRQTSGTNLVRNASFELGSAFNAAGNMNFDGWGIGANSQSCGAEAFASTESAVGSQAIRLQKLSDCFVGDSRGYAYQQVDVGTPIGGRTFTFSFYAKADSAACTPSAHLRAITPAADNDENAGPNPFVVTTEWQRFVVTHTWSTIQNPNTEGKYVNPTETKIAIFLRTSPSCTMYYDGIQLEEGELTDYKDYGAVNQVHLKRPPSGYCANNLNRTCEVDTDCYNPLTEPPVTCQKLQCTGNTATDPAACSNFVAKCAADDVGCDLFTPVAGGMNIPAKPGQSCPADKVGCASFREQPTIGALDAHDTRTGKYCASLMATEMRSCTDDADCGGVVGDCTPLVSFIGTSGTQCTAQDVGCEAYTNLDEVAKGGEGKAQFTKLQLCVPPAPLYTGLLSNYYSWVGNEESGYQLKKYILVPSNLGGGVAPCTNLAHDTLTCIDGTPNHPVASCTAADLGVDLDCAQYYDDSGNITYRLRSRVIEQTENCHPFRNEVDTNTYYADSARSLSCSSEVVGCREYVGNTGSNTRTLLTSDFENGSYSPWATGIPNPISPESVTFGGHSLHVPANAQADITGMLRQGATYLVSFWAKAEAANTPITFGLQATAGSVPLGITTPVTTEWNAYTLGPTTIPFSTTGNNLLTASGTAAFFLDNVVLTEITDSTYKVKSSQTVCGGYEGCAAYQNRAGQVVNLMSFAKLCQTEKVGCEALINTRNSSTPVAQTVTLANLRGDVDGSGKIDQADVDALSAYLGSAGAPPFPLVAGDINASGGNPDFTDLSALTSYVRGTGGTISSATYPGDTVTTAADSVEYWVNDPTKACNAEDKGCRALGKQQINLSATTYAPTLQNTETVYVRDNPDTYATTLCGRDALFCEEFGISDGGKTYFRNPTGRTCEYRDATGAIGAGWFVSGTSSPTPNCPIRSQGNIPPPVPNGGFAGLCPADQNGCGAFLDPLGTGESFTTNSGFEIADGAAPQNWTPGTSLEEYADHDGSKAVRLTLENAGLFFQTVDMNPNRYYVVSVDVERNADATETNPVHFGLTGCRDAFGAQVRLYSPDSSMTSDNSGAYQEIAAENFSDTAYQRISGRVFSGTAVTCRAFAGTVGNNLGHWFDNLQVRATTSSTVLRQTVDSTSCNGQVGDKLGCHLFNDTSNTALTYDVDQSPLGSAPTDADAVGGTASCADQPELCDSNTVLKVVRDRVCSQWLAPTTTVESTKATGQKENLVVGLATCDTFSPGGQCSRFVDEKRCSNNPKQTCVSNSNCGAGGVCKPFPLNGNTQAYSREELRNRSGLVVAGMQFGKACSQDRSMLCTTDADCGAGNTCLPDQTIKGKFPFGIAPQLGGDTATIDASVFNGNFDKTADVRNSGWIMEPVTAQSPGGPKLSIVTQDDRGTGSNVAPTAVDPYLLLDPGPDQDGWPTVRTKAGSLSNRLNRGKTYYLSFKARFMATPETATRTIVGIVSAEDFDGTTRTWSAQHYWSHAIQLTDQWQTYVVGPFKLDPAATSAEGNHYAGVHDAFNPSNGSIFFSYTSAQVETNPKLAIDSVSLLSVLQVRDTVTQSFTYQPVSGDVYIARSCRAYPSATAKVCSYTDDTGKQFNGWQGFCLETDPQNPNTCLSWYPVDLLTGDRNIFGKMEAAGYNDKAPLYMCVRATGNYNRPVNLSYQGAGRTAVTTFDSSIVMNSTAGPEELISPLLNKEFNYRRPAVTRMRGYYHESILDATNIIAGKPGELCESNTWPGLCAASIADCGSWVDLTNSGSSDYWVPDAQDRYRRDEIEKIVLIHQSGEPKEWNARSWLPKNGQRSCYSNDCTTYAPTYFGPTPDGQAYMVLDHNADGKCWGDPNCWAATWVGPAEARANSLTFRVDFDPVTQRVSRFGFSGLDGTCGGGFAATVLFYLREQCTEVVQVAEANGQNAAWSGHTTSTSFALPNYQYKLAQEDKPFGSIVPPADAFDNPLQWGAVLQRPLDVKQNTVDARAGSAYACAGPGTCRGRLCFLPMTTSVMNRAGVSYSCDTVADEQKCVSNGGYCNGFGRAKVCVSGPKANPTDPVACTYDAECGTAGKCDYIDTPPTFPNQSGGWYAGGKTDAQAITHLKVLFADAYGGWNWNATTRQYEVNNALINNWRAGYAGMVQCGDAGRPVIGTAATEATLASAYCGNPPEVLNVAVGKTSSSTVFINSGEVIQLKFNTNVDKQQQPLKAIAVDWDGNNQSDQLVSWGYAPLTNIAEPHSISHAYRFGDGMNLCYERGAGPYGNNASVGDHAYCIVRPGVQVQDNWNWCNGGRCLATFPVPDDQNYWQKFSGEVVVISP